MVLKKDNSGNPVFNYIVELFVIVSGILIALFIAAYSSKTGIPQYLWMVAIIVIAGGLRVYQSKKG